MYLLDIHWHTLKLLQKTASIKDKQENLPAKKCLLQFVFEYWI